jgi:hypothetical protein
MLALSDYVFSENRAKLLSRQKFPVECVLKFQNHVGAHDKDRIYV